MTTASMVTGSTGNSAQFISRSFLPPWNMPQSTSTLARGVSTRNFEPVTVRAAPRKRTSGRGGWSVMLRRYNEGYRARQRPPAKRQELAAGALFVASLLDPIAETETGVGPEIDRHTDG